MSWKDEEQWRANATPRSHEPSTASLQRLDEEESARPRPLSARLTGLSDALLGSSDEEPRGSTSWVGLHRTDAEDEPELSIGSSFVHRRVTSFLLGANVLSVFIFMAEMDPNDAETDHLGGVFLVVLLSTALSLVQALGIRHGRQLLYLCRTRGGICGRMLARPLVVAALVAVPVGAFCNSYFATHCALHGCPNLDLEKSRETDPDIWTDLKEVVCALQNLLALIGMVEVVLLLCDPVDQQPRDESWSPRDWWQWGDRRRAQRSYKVVMFFLGLMQPVGVALASLDRSSLSSLPIPTTSSAAVAVAGGLAREQAAEDPDEDGLFTALRYEHGFGLTGVVDDGSAGGGGAGTTGGTASSTELLMRMIGQPMMVLSLLHWFCLPSILGWCSCACCNAGGSGGGGGGGSSFQAQRRRSFTALTCALFFNLACWFAYMDVPRDESTATANGGDESKPSCFWVLPGAVVHIYIFCSVGLSVLFGPVVRNSRSVYVFGCLTLLGCCLYGIFGVLQFVHLQHATADVSALWGRDCDKLLHEPTLPLWGLYLRSGQAMLPLAEAVYFCALLSKRNEVRTEATC